MSKMQQISHLSYSQIMTYLSCNLTWKYQYLDGIEPEEKSDSLAFGKAWHEYLKNAIIAGGGYALSRWNAIAKDLKEDQIELGKRMAIATEMNVAQVNPWQAELSSFEVPVTFEVPGVPIPIVGLIDMIDSSGIPVDFKTSRGKWNQDKADLDWQATFYLYPLWLQGKGGSYSFKYLVFTKTKKPEMQTLYTVRTDAHFLKLEQFIQIVYQSMLAGGYTPADPNSWKCSEKYCPFWRFCKFGGKE